ncbi:hypothetical protein BOX15_Mlig012706g1 [Macrostomum lignano]|uniref:DNA-directed RNA polymerase subunit n=3 Tax=Macrostomum lignano TaxID=282301 RepID=A0A267GEG4_9PLAT|nr:hypothetical protein BOX15_Mlig012706g1 [Macrostomum lignano]
MKEQFYNQNVTKKVSHVTFTVLSADEIRAASHMRVTTKDMYNLENRKPADGGVLDPRLGTCRKNESCAVCGDSFHDCMGHFGYVDLALPVFHCGYLNHIVKILQSICKSCSRVLLSGEKRHQYLNVLRRPNLSYLAKKALRKKIHSLAKSVHNCPHCNAVNGFVKKGGLAYVLHDKFRFSKGDALAKHAEQFAYMIEKMPELKPLVDKGIEPLRALQVLQLLNAIPLEDIPLLCMHSDRAHPRDLILTRVPVPPNALRPSVVSEVRAGTTEDDITAKLSDIAFLNRDVLNKQAASNRDMVALQQAWDILTYVTAQMINSENSGIPTQLLGSRSFVRGYIQRLKGKQGRFRGHLSGKRANFTARTVISPDPNLRIDQVGVPEFMARKLTYPSRVTSFNIEQLRRLIRNGAHQHPGALYVEAHDGRFPKRMLEFSNEKFRSKIANELRCGDTVERHLMDEDTVLFNRQPSLHRVSIQAFRVSVKPYRTLRFNECCCTPFNADFDGDEMNLHVPQTEEARAEAKQLMASVKNMSTPRNGEPLIAAIQDFITGAYLITCKDVFFNRDRAAQLLVQSRPPQEKHLSVRLPPPAICKPVELWSGKQIFSCILHPYPINLATKTKAIYTDGEEFCTNDGYVLVRSGELLAGRVDKKIIGSGSKENLVYLLLRDFGGDACATVLARLTRLIPAYLSHRGFSIGLGDVTPGPRLLEAKAGLVRFGFDRCRELIRQYEAGTLPTQPGCSGQQTLENAVSKQLSDIRDEAGKACRRDLHPASAPLVMAHCGSKGSFLNVSQMVACVGQQIISGKRTPDGFEGRSLPHFPRRSLLPQAKGFVENSFFSGLSPTEFFFHTMSGREGLVDTAVKTADTGYMQRRLMKALEDLCCHYDGTVRGARGEVVQFAYGGDGFDPMEMEAKSHPVDFDRLADLARTLHLAKTSSGSAMSSAGISCPLLPDQQTEAELNSSSRNLSPLSAAYKAGMEACAKRRRLAKKPWHQIYVDLCRAKHRRALIEPGTPVGALCAQSIGEPATQMTLKTFHFAGVASMNITQGVPRIRELINAIRAISTPIITARLTPEAARDEGQARRIKACIEPTRLSEICLSISECIEPDEVSIRLKLDLQRLAILKLRTTPKAIGAAIVSAKLGGYKIKGVDMIGADQLAVYPEDVSTIRHLRANLESVIVRGLSSVTRAIIHRDNRDSDYTLFVEGSQLAPVLCIPGVDGCRTQSNSVLEMASVLGIESARATLVREMLDVMAGHGVEVDTRHVNLLADLMTQQGEVLGNQRHGIAKLKESVLMLASFEQTADHLFEAAYHGQTDDLSGVSESIILGKPTRLGTGLFSLLMQQDSAVLTPPRRPVIFDSYPA